MENVSLEDPVWYHLHHVNGSIVPGTPPAFLSY